MYKTKADRLKENDEMYKTKADRLKENVRQLLNNSVGSVHNLELIDAVQRLLRQHGYDVPQDVFDRYKDDEMASLKMCLSEDVKGMLSLYEASYFGLEGEDFMDAPHNALHTWVGKALNRYRENSAWNQEDFCTK